MHVKLMNPSAPSAVMTISAPTQAAMDENSPRPISLTTLPTDAPACVKKMGATGVAGSTVGTPDAQPDPLIASPGPSTVCADDELGGGSACSGHPNEHSVDMHPLGTARPSGALKLRLGPRRQSHRNKPCYGT